MANPSSDDTAAQMKQLTSLVQHLAVRIENISNDPVAAPIANTRSAAGSVADQGAVRIGAKKNKKHWSEDQHLQGLDFALLEENVSVAHAIRDFTKKLLGRLTAVAPFPLPPTPDELRALESRNPNLSSSAATPIASSSVSFGGAGFSDFYCDTVRSHLARSGLTRLTFDLVGDPELKGRYNLFICNHILELLRQAALQREITLVIEDIPEHIVLIGILRRYWSTLVKQAVLDRRSPAGLRLERQRRTANKAQQRLLEEYRAYLVAALVDHNIIRVFNLRAVLMAVEAPPNEQLEEGRKIVSYPSWWSEALVELMKLIEEKVHRRWQINRMMNRRGADRKKRVYLPALDPSYPLIPTHLPINLVDPTVLAEFDDLERRTLRLSPPLDLPDNIKLVIPRSESDRHPVWRTENGRDRESSDEGMEDLEDHNSLFGDGMEDGY